MNHDTGREELQAREDWLDRTVLARLRELGGRDFLAEMIDLFLEDAPKRIKAARAAEQEQDLEAVRMAAHSLKSSAGNLGADALRDLAGKIERLAADKKSDTMSELVSELEQKFALVQARLKAEKRGLGPEDPPQGGGTDLGRN